MSATDPVSEAREMLSAAYGLADPLDWHVEHGRIVNGSGTQIASMSGGRVWMGDADLIAAAPRLLAALADEVEMLADEVRKAKASAWDEGRAAGVDMGLSIGERIVGTRSNWPTVPKNPYHAESIESQDNVETASPDTSDA